MKKTDSTQNIVLTGMPGSGKSTIGKLLKIENYTFVDTDEEIQKECGCTIKELIQTKGEPYFRDLETKVIKEVSSKNCQIISTGGGAILKNENVDYLKQNGKIFFINAALERLCATEDRPLSDTKEKLTKLYEQRINTYLSTADVIVPDMPSAQEEAEYILRERNCIKASFSPCTLNGTIKAPPSKSMTHRYLIGAALSGKKCTLNGIDYSEDILASIDCLKALGCKITTDKDTVFIDPQNFMQVENPVLECRESGSTLRFFIPLALCLGKTVVLKGSTRLFERPLDVYKNLCKEKGFIFQKDIDSVTVSGNLTTGEYTILGDISSQFITRLIFAPIKPNA